MPIRVNLSDVQDGFEVLPKGRYQVKVTDYEEKEAGENAKNPGSIFYQWELTVVNGVEGDKYEGRKLFLNTSLLPQALFALKGLLTAAGWSEQRVNDPNLEFEPDELMNQEFIAVVTIKPYNGEDRNNVSRTLPLSAGLGAEATAGASLLP